MSVRKIVKIDEDKCNGCGECVPACAEGALRIIDGKARLVSDVYCDGLGACLGHCPRGAITIVEREAEQFDENAVEGYLQRQRAAPEGVARQRYEDRGGCPGSQVRQSPQPRASRSLPMAGRPDPASTAGDAGRSASDPAARGLSHWPVQLKLVPPQAPFLREADLVLTADCVPAALVGFHQEVLRGRPMALGCPKLDEVASHVAKLGAIIAQSALKRLTVVRMEVPCCGGLVAIANAARQQSGRNIPIETVTVGLDGAVMSSEQA